MDISTTATNFFLMFKQVKWRHRCFSLLNLYHLIYGMQKDVTMSIAVFLDRKLGTLGDYMQIFI